MPVEHAVDSCQSFPEVYLRAAWHFERQESAINVAWRKQHVDNVCQHDDIVRQHGQLLLLP